MDDKKTIIEVNNSYSIIRGFEPPGISEVIGKRIKTFVKRGGKTTVVFRLISLFSAQGYFPSGLVNDVYNHCLKYTTDVEIIDKRIKPVATPYKLKKPIEVREQIKDGIENALLNSRGIYNYITSAGKSRWAIDLIAKTGLRTLYIVPGLGLLQQIQNDFVEYIDTSIGIIGDGEKDYVFTDTEVWIPNILITTSASLWSLYKNEPKFFEMLCKTREVMIIDESHHVRFKSTKVKGQSWNSWFVICMKMKAAFYRIGLTGSLYNEDDLGLMMLRGVTGKVQAKYSRIEAEQDGVVCPFEARIYEVACPQVKGWHGSYNAGIIENDEHNDLVVQISRDLANEGKRVLVIFDQVEKHIKKIAELLPEAVVLTGHDDGDTRMYELERLAKGEINIVLSTVMSEGVNVPSIDAIVLASGKGADDTVSIKLTQRIGRGSRMSEGKDKLIVVDFFHYGNKILHNHSENRIKVMEELGGEIIYMKNKVNGLKLCQ